MTESSRMLKKSQAELEEKIKKSRAKLEEKIENSQNSQEKPYNKDEHRDKTRSWLARLFVWGYFGIIVILIIGIPTYNIFVIRVDKTLVLDFENTYTSITSSIVGLLGFVLGFYFKEGEK